MTEQSTISDNEESASYVRPSGKRLARLESDLAHLARMMMRLPQGHATVAEYKRLREIAERVEGADDGEA